jgi:hypothetical protein
MRAITRIIITGINSAYPRSVYSPSARIFSEYFGSYQDTRCFKKEDHLMEAVVHNQPKKVKHALEIGISPNHQDPQVNKASLFCSQISFEHFPLHLLQDNFNSTDGCSRKQRT